MLRKLYSKRSGFTLIEIIIAFVVFAIMASMICQILDLAVRARNSNTAYQRELDDQEHILTLIEKDKNSFKGEQGKIKVGFNDGTNLELPYDRLSAKPDAESDGEGLNYFISNVDYNASGEGTPSGGGGNNGGGTNTGSQASRMDTRITGTGGLKCVEINKVIKDTHTYAAGDPFAIPKGHTRYIIMCTANGGEKDKDLMQEDVPYSQYRLYFYHEPANNSADAKKESLDAAASAVEYTDELGRTYTKEVYKAANIVKVGYLKKFTGTDIGEKGLTSSDVLADVDNNNNKYTVEHMGKNVVRIGSPLVENNENSGLNKKGVRFAAGSPSYFYIEFEGDPHITVDSFGKTSTTGTTDGAKAYGPCPVYKDEYKEDGTPEYSTDAKAGNYVNIYGAFMHTRKYK